MSQEPLIQADMDVHCPECDYNLTGVPSDRCPWCGWHIDLDVLLLDAVSSHVPRRVALIVTSLVVGLGTLLVTYSLTIRGGRFGVFDLITVAGTTTAASCSIALAIWIVVTWKNRWPLRRGDLAGLLRWATWASIAAGIIGAIPALQFAPTTLVVQNTVVNGPLEFILAAVIFTLPGWMILVLLTIAFRHARRKMQRAEQTLLSDQRSSRSPFIVEVFHRYAPEQIKQRWTNEPRPTTPQIERSIETIWEAETAIAREFNRVLFNGKLVRLVTAVADPNSLSLELGPTDYREFLGTNLHNLRATLMAGPEYLSNALGVSATVITADGFLAFGRRSDRVAAQAGALHAFGGMLEQADRLPDGTCDLFGSIRRELVEELGLAHAEITDVAIAGLVRDKSLAQPEMLFEAKISLLRDTLLKRFSPSLSHEEHEGIEFVRDEPDAILPFLDATPSISPVTQAALLLHGRHAWGGGWYEKCCLLLYGELPSHGRF